MRCLSKSNMKVSDREVELLVKELDDSNQGKINYKDLY